MTEPTKKLPPPFPCAGYSCGEGGVEFEFDCDYPYAGKVDCSDCVLNGGQRDPRTGKRYVERRKVAKEKP